MVWLLILLGWVLPLCGMDGSSSGSCALVKAIRAGEHEKVAMIIANEDRVNAEVQGSYPLHWAVLSLLKPVKDPANMEKELEERMKISNSLLRLGADYLLQEKDSKRTIFHIIAFHLSRHSDNKLVLCALDNMLKGICKVWFCKSSIKEEGQQSFVREITELYERKNKINQTVIEIATEKDCKTVFSKERLIKVYEVAYTELHSE
jgi:hypothetical protein